ncbi:unnamed protein product [Rhizoctonia solani]|uniref:PPPDE domain-containing protein n=1 Tax=Rhizoctonia solani TaxID=456999 RepID=A0A8H2XR17_9AGAM|nr:unnamed protein product [Rhizoctonia solani]
MIPGSSRTTSRLHAIFPLSLDIQATSGRLHHTLQPNILYQTLTYHYHPDKHVESTIVKSAWYGKQTKGVEHEFILLKVTDTVVNVNNYIILDRNHTSHKVGDSGWSTSGSACSSWGAFDSFKVSSNGIEEELLGDCGLWHREYLEKLRFERKENPLFFYELVTLVDLISEENPIYDITQKNCYWFAGLIWECLRKMRPSAKMVKIIDTPGKKGKLGPLRYFPDLREIDEVHQRGERRIMETKSRLMLSVDVRSSVAYCLARELTKLHQIGELGYT